MPSPSSTNEPVRITRIVIEGMRGIDRLELGLRPMNVLIGENGSGKSTVLEALVLLQKAATLSGEQLTNRLYNQHGGSSLFRLHNGTVRGPLRLGLDLLSGGSPASYKLTLRNDGGHILVEEEHLTFHAHPGRPEPLRIVKRRGSDAEVFDPRVGRPVPVEVSPQEVLLGSLRNLDQGDTPKNARGAQLREAIGNLQVFAGFDTGALWAKAESDREAPLRSRTFFRKALRLEPNGSNLANAYHSLKNHPSVDWGATLADLRLGLGDQLEDVVVEASVTGGEVGLSLRVRGVGLVPAFALSDGQLSFLALVAALKLDGGPLIAFDEPDKHLHPALVGRFVDFAEAASERQTVVVATHSDRLLDALSTPLDSVVLFERDAEQRTIALRPNAAQMDHWLQEYSGVGSARAQGFGSSISQRKTARRRTWSHDAQGGEGVVREPSRRDDPIRPARACMRDGG